MLANSSWQGAVAVVTGAASGIGRALATELVGRDAIVIAADRLDAELSHVVHQLSQTNKQIMAHALDVSDFDQVKLLIARACQRFGTIDYIFNCAGVGQWGELLDLTSDQWNQLLGSNLAGVIHGTRCAYEVMVKQGHGHIVNVASLAGLVPVPGAAAYAAAKHAVVGLSTSLRAEAARHGVRVSVVCPGVVKTGFQSALIRTGPAHAKHAEPRNAVDAQTAALSILKGVARNQEVIVFPARAWRTWMRFRYLRWTYRFVERELVRRLSLAADAQNPRPTPN